MATRLWDVQLTCAAVVLAGIAATALADSAVILGAGSVGTWFTTGYVTNPASAAIHLDVAPRGICPALCPFSGVSVPPLGSIPLETLLVWTAGGVQTIYVFADPQSPAVAGGGAQVGGSRKGPAAGPA